MGDQVIAPSTFADQPSDVPAWAAEPEVPAPSGSSREQAIAEVLRAALALGHSDEALAGILRKVLAGVAPQTALAEPELSVPVRTAPEVAVPPAAVPVELAAPVLEPLSPPELATPVLFGRAAADDVAVVSETTVRGRVETPEPASAPIAAAPLFPVASPLPAAPPTAAPPTPASPTLRTEPAPLFAAPAPSLPAPAPSFAAPAPFALPPLFAPSPGSMWGDPSPAPLWGEPVTVAVSRVRQPEAPIWGEVASGDDADADIEAEVPTEVEFSAEVDPDSSSSEEPAPVQDVVLDEYTEEPLVCDELPAVDSTEVDAPDLASDLLAVDVAVEEVPVPDVAADTETRLGDELDVDGLVDDLVHDLVEPHEVEQVIEVLVETAVAESADAADADPETTVETEVAAGAEPESAVEAEVAAEEQVATEVEVAAESDAVTTVAELAPTLARTASDPAPFMSLDSTTVMPPLSLLPPLPSSRGRGRPPVPPASRPLSRRAPSAPVSPSAPAPTQTAEGGTDTDVPVTARATAAPATRSWATVTRLPVAPLMATPQTPEMPELETVQADEGADAFPSDSASQLPGAGDVRGRLEALGLPADLLGDSFDDDVAGQGTYAALTNALARRLPVAPELPAGAGEVLLVVGPGVETLRAARSLAATLRLDRDAVQWATRGELAGLAPKGSRMTTVETAIDRQQDAATSGSVTIVAVDAPLRTDSYWMSQMLAIWAPTAVWVVVEATRKPEDLEPWIDGLPRVDALVVTDADLSADPAAVLRRMSAPVAILDGVRATPHRWASLLCERLEKTKP